MSEPELWKGTLILTNPEIDWGVILDKVEEEITRGFRHWIPRERELNKPLPKGRYVLK